MSKGLFYHYFPTKRDLYVAGIREAARELLETIAPPADLAPPERLRRGLDAYIDYVIRHERAYVGLMRGGIGFDREVMAVLEETRSFILDRLLEGAEQAPLAPRPATPRLRLALRGWIGFVEAAILDWIERRGLERDALRDFLADAFVAALKVAAPR